MSEEVDPAVLDRVRGVVAQTLRIDPALIQVDTPIIAALGAESLDLLEMRFLLEGEFHVRITDAELREWGKGVSTEEIVNRFCAGTIARGIQERLAREPKG